MLPPALLALSPGTLRESDFGRWLAGVRAVFDAGVRGLLLREHALTDAAYVQLAVETRALWPREHGGWLCVHDRAHLVEALDADAVHLGGHSLSPTLVRAWLPAGVAIGISTHAGDDVESWKSADYIFHGPVQRTDKPGARAPIGFDGLRAAVEASAVPVWALGGLRAEHAAEVRQAGAQGMALLSGIFGARDCAAAARAYVSRWTAAAGT